MKSFLFLAAALALSLGGFAQSPTRATTAAERIEGLQQRSLLIRQSMLSNIGFRNIGPSVMGGRAVDLAVNPADPTEFFVAYATGGLWYTHNNGQSFVPLFDTLPVITIGAIAVNWSGKLPEVWVGTGEANSSRSSYAGNGIYKSKDGGHSWSWLGLPESQHIGKILLDPQNPRIAWVAATGHLYSPNPERGVYRTMDGGKTWDKVLYLDDQTGAIDLALDPQHPDTLYAAMWYKYRMAWNFEASGKTSGIYKSVDGGSHWSLVSGPGSGFPTGEGVGRIGLTVFPPNPRIIYAIIDNNFHRPVRPEDTSHLRPKDFLQMNLAQFAALNKDRLNDFLRDNGFPEKYTADSVKAMVAAGRILPSALHDYVSNALDDMYDTPVIGAEIYRSDNGGQTWKKMNKDFLSLYASYGYYFGKIWVSPANPGKLVIAGISLLMSQDSGQSFHDIDADNIHGDHHALWFDPARDNHFINANDGGLNITYDDGLHWFKCNTPAVGQFYSITTDNAKPYNVYGGLQDNGVWWGPSDNVDNPGWLQDGNYPFKAINGGDGMQVQVDGRDNNTVYSGYQFGYYARNYRNNPSDYKSIHPQVDLGTEPLRWNWQTPILLSSHNPDVFYMGSDRFHRSMDKADSMVTLSGDLTNAGFGLQGNVPYGTITTLSESPIRFGLIYAGTDDGNIQVSEDDGYDWTKISDQLPQKLWISRVVASAFSENRVYAALNGYRYDNFRPYLYMSEDRGSHWQAIGTNLPEGPVNVVREDPCDENILYVGTDNGLYVSIDRGKNFMTMMGGLPSVPVHDIAIQATDSEIVLGTHGRSVYIASLKEIRKLPALINLPLAILRLSPPDYSKNWGNKIDDQVVEPSMKLPFFVRNAGTTTIQILDSNGQVVHQQIDTAAAGFNFPLYDLSVDSTFVHSRHDTAFSLAQNHQYYLVPGEYKLEIINAAGDKAVQLFRIIENSGNHRHRRSGEAAPEKEIEVQ